MDHGPTVMRVCRALLAPADADDAWSETFLSAMRAFPDLRPESNVRGWLVTIAYRKAIDQIRRTNRNPRPTDRLPEVVGEHELPAGSDDDLRAALDGLPPKQRDAVVYHYLADLPYREVGVLLECTEAAARRSAADGIANLRKSYRNGPQR